MFGILFKPGIIAHELYALIMLMTWLWCRQYIPRPYSDWLFGPLDSVWESWAADMALDLEANTNHEKAYRLLIKDPKP